MKGIGPHFAKRLVEAFGTDVFDVIEQEPDRLRDVPGIGAVRAARIAEGWQAQRNVREIMVFLHAHGVGTSRAVRIYKTYGSDAIGLIRENPYRLARDIRGIGFVTADRIAAQARHRADGDHPRARRAAARAAARRSTRGTRACRARNCLDARDEAARRAGRRSSARRSTSSSRDGELVADTVDGTPVVFLAWLHAAERAIADAPARPGRRARRPGPRIDAERAIAWVEERLSLTLAPSSSARRCGSPSSRKVLVITGGPGVGKTTLMQRHPARAVRQGGQAAAVRADGPRRQAAGGEHRDRGEDHPPAARGRPAHRAVPARRAPAARGRPRRRRRDVDGRRPADARAAAGRARARAALILVGDVDQLPSVGPGQVLADVIDSGRRAGRAAHRGVPAGGGEPDHRRRAPHQRGRDARPAAADGPERLLLRRGRRPRGGARSASLQIVAQRIPQRFGLDPLRDVQVLCPMNRGGRRAPARSTWRCRRR